MGKMCFKINCVVCDRELGPIHFDLEPLDTGDTRDRCCLDCRILICEIIINNESIKEKNNDY
tara:strand:+ start:1959 stop:2144 length:186 start_codon:yes stop_codon:yes gene_type:complete